MYFNEIRYQLYRLAITPKDLSLFSGLSQSKCYRLANLSPIELLNISYSDIRAIELAIQEIESINTFNLQVDNVYRRYRNTFGNIDKYHYTLCAFLMYCKECNEYIYSFDTYDNGYMQACKRCNSEFITQV